MKYLADNPSQIVVNSTIYAAALIDTFLRTRCQPPDDLLALEFSVIAWNLESSKTEKLEALTFLLAHYRLSIVATVGRLEIANSAMAEIASRCERFAARQTFHRF